jgi:hypothetical protein
MKHKLRLTVEFEYERNLPANFTPEDTAFHFESHMCASDLIDALKSQLDALPSYQSCLCHMCKIEYLGSV